jgi:predicted transcriptional regulator/ribosomal protein S18 acetylase RimI-like enzyme
MKDLQLARIMARDAKGLSDHLRNLRSIVCEKEDLYPGIDKWFDKQVISGISQNGRVAYVGYVDGVPAAAAIVKLGDETKLCHINVRPDVRGTGVGEILLSLVALEAKSNAKAIHVTFPDSLWSSKREFFQSFGFCEVQKAKRQYRLFDEELSSRTSFSTIWNAVLAKLPKLAQKFSLGGSQMNGGVLFSVRPEFGNSIMNGTKTIEIRRRFSKAWKGERAVFYASEPTAALLGQADIVAVHQGSPENIWKRYSSRIRCPREYFRDYVRGCDEVFAVELANPSPLMEPVYNSVLSRYTSRPLHAPQSYVALTDQQGWSEAVSIAVMLQCLHKRIRVFENAAETSKMQFRCKPQKQITALTPTQEWTNFEFDLF